jgi:hypothetical protein
MNNEKEDWVEVAVGRSVRQSVLGDYVSRFRNKHKRDWLDVATPSPASAIALFDFLKGRPLTDVEIRKAITCILLSDYEYTEKNGRRLIAALFNPQMMPKEFNQEQTVVFKKTGKGHSNEWRDFSLAMVVQLLRDDGKPYRKAIDEVAAGWGVSVRHIERIYTKYKNSFHRQPWDTTPDIPSDVTTSDSRSQTVTLKK